MQQANYIITVVLFLADVSCITYIDVIIVHTSAS